jgi:tetratricopeptide (TPR) repeat protein
MRRILVSSMLALALTLVLGPRTARATGIEPLSTQFHINHADPESTVPTDAEKNAKPLEFGYYLQDLIAFAMAADKSGDHLGAARYYRAFAKAVPDESIAFQKLCESLQKAGQREQAMAACRDALGRPGIDVNDYARYATLVLAKQGALTDDELEDLNTIVEHLRKDPGTRTAGIHIQCELAMHNSDVSLLQQCSGELAATAPNDPKTISFQWAAAMRAGNGAEARRLVQRARVNGMKPAGLQKMEEATDALDSGFGRRALKAGVVVVSVFGAVLLALVQWRRRGPRQAASAS